MLEKVTWQEAENRALCDWNEDFVEYLESIGHDPETWDYDDLRCWVISMGWDPVEEDTFEVSYAGGESREVPGKGVDYMIVAAKDADGDDVELYAEMENPTARVIDGEPVVDDERATYEELKAEIIRQAKEAGVDTGLLDFSHC